ncbi:hypothetical protein QYM36_011467 [Artemia franciscana]|uniref:Uncharacterized protein n=1 Tax=Artemia franciscana TaxID=6661 RepID=A0AA88HIR0_ARTSF|nr:hypothetical protein QYM36_011467 [Artemia franciscana]
MSITSLPKASGSPGGVAMITKDGVADLEQLFYHMQWIHTLKVYPKMMDCPKCQCHFFPDQRLQRQLLGGQGLVISSMQEAANRGHHAGRCPVCDKSAEAQKEAKKSEGKPGKINDEMTIISQPSKGVEGKGETVTLMLKKLEVNVIPKGSAIGEPSKKDNCKFCSTNEKTVKFQGNKVPAYKNCKKKLVNKDGVEFLTNKNNADTLDIDDEENNESGKDPAGSRAHILFVPVKKEADSASGSSSSEKEDEVKPAEPTKIVAPLDNLDLD